MRRLRGWLVRTGLAVLVVAGLAAAAGMLVYPELAVGSTPEQWARALRHDWPSVRLEARRRLLDAGAPAVDPLAAEIREHPDVQYEAFRVLTRMYFVADDATIDRVDATLRELESSGNRRIRGQVLACYVRSRDAREAWLMRRFRDLGVMFRGEPGARPPAGRRVAYPFTAVVGDAWTGDDEEFTRLGEFARLKILQVRNDANVSEEAIRAVEERKPKLAVVRRGTACIGIAGRMPRPPYESLRVLGVDPESGAARAGLRLWDRVVYVGGLRVDDEADLYERLRTAEPGDRVPILILRDDVWTWIDLELGHEDASGFCRCTDLDEQGDGLPAALPDFARE